MRIQAPREKVVIVSNFVSLLDAVQELCVSRGGWAGAVLRLDGTVLSEDRSTIVTALNNSFDKRWILLLSSKAGGVGLNL